MSRLVTPADVAGGISAPAGRSAGIVTPDEVPGLSFWYDARDLSLADGSSVTSWPDKSSIGRDMSQGTATNQPTYRASPTGFNGQPAVEFDGQDDYLINTANPYQETTGEVFYVVRNLSLQDGFVMAVSDTDTDDEFWNFRSDLTAATSPTGNPEFEVAVKSSSQDGPNIVHTTSFGAAINETYLISFRGDGSNWTMRESGQDLADTARNGVETGTWSGHPASIDNFTLGILDRSSGLVGAGHIQLGMTFGYDRVLNTKEREDLEAYLNDIFAVF